MRTINVRGRLALVVGDGYVDVETASQGRFAADPQAVFSRWAEFRKWASEIEPDGPTPLPESGIASPVPKPPQVFAIGVNYRSHAAEGDADVPTSPMVFTKFPASIAGPGDTILLPEGPIDFEAELVVVIGKEAFEISESDAWEHVAGLTVGQDLTNRQLQLQPPFPQFSLSKSYLGFSPMGPTLVTPDEFDDPNDLLLGCRLNGEQMQEARTSDFVFSIAQVIAYLSSILPLWPGDAIFTGTPEGVGFLRKPQVLIQPGDVLETTIEGIGTMTNRFASRAA